MEPSVGLTILFNVWVGITSVLVILLIYRATLASREDDQIFINAAEHLHEEEQQEILTRINRLRRPLIALAATSAVLFVSSVGLWLYEGVNSF